jgi:hypothetical protein
VVETGPEIVAAYRYGEVNRGGYSEANTRRISLRILHHAKGNTMQDNETAPEYGRIAEACRRFGLSRSRLYLLAGEGQVRFVKAGFATLVDLGSVRDYLAACPCAQVRSPKSAT